MSSRRRGDHEAGLTAVFGNMAPMRIALESAQKKKKLRLVSRHLASLGHEVIVANTTS